MKEDKVKICKKLVPVLQETRHCENLLRLDYRADGTDEYVTAKFDAGSDIEINVSCDGGLAMIKDIVEALL